MEQQLQKLYSHVVNLLESKIELIKALDDLRREIVMLEEDWSSRINWSYLLEDLKHEVDGVDLNTALGFIDDIEQQITDVPYKLKRADASFKLAVNPILKNTPVYFDTVNPPEDSDYLEPPTENKHVP